MPGIHLLAIDFQHDFCDPTGALHVPGADDDARRLASLVRRLGDRIDAITLTLDSHHPRHIAHPLAWVDREGRHPAPFTILSEADVREGRWTASAPGEREWQRGYIARLAEGGRYPLCIWPEHCLIGSPGHALHPDVFAAVADWERGTLRVAEKLLKGANVRTEHYSAIRAEVPDPEDPGTRLARESCERLLKAETILVAGEALSHCVANTVRDLAEAFGDEILPRLLLLQDASSCVPGFEDAGERFTREMARRGLRMASTSDW